ncbi:amidohydrolase family protein [Actinocorallia populi]|uniref:amidohydrolase family protein n=1 Tax=Actinocorallia populi TaxID=2079200 RepID=UPI000D090A67|nr:amidohydrolase family protein [Actinocorallia populi]
MEPLWLWPQYVEPAFRDRCLQVVRDPADGDKLLIDGTPSRLIRRLGGVAPRDGHEILDWNHLPATGEFVSYRDSCTITSWNGPARLNWLDQAGIDATLLFPSLGLIWPREIDPISPYAEAHFDAYNRWLLDMTSAAPGRLIPVAQTAFTPYLSTRLAALADEGFGHVMLPAGLTSFADADLFFATVQDLGLVVHLHKVAIPHFLPSSSGLSLRSDAAGAFFNHVNETLPGPLCLAALLDTRIPDRFPGIRFAFHECNAGWLPSWLDRAQESWETLRRNKADRLPNRPPAEYFTEADTFFFSIGLGEDVTAMPAWLRRRLMLATDYPHPGTPADPTAEWKPVLDRLPPSDARALQGGNAHRLLT